MVRAIRLALAAVDSNWSWLRALWSKSWRVFFTITLRSRSPAFWLERAGVARRSVNWRNYHFVSNIPGETRTIPLAMYT